MKELKDLVVGDNVVAYDKYDNRRIAIVERITKTLVVVNNIKYRKSDGFASGESYIFSRRIEIPKDEEQIKAIKLEYHDTLCDGRKLDVQPDMIADCTNLPFEDETFNMVVFDPPHLLKVGQNSWLCKKYGKQPENWQAFINDSIHEGMRVLKTNGTLIFKWNEQQINVSDVLKAITDYKPIFGHRTTIKNQTIWMVFIK